MGEKVLIKFFKAGASFKVLVKQKMNKICKLKKWTLPNNWLIGVKACQKLSKKYP